MNSHGQFNSTFYTLSGTATNYELLAQCTKDYEDDAFVLRTSDRQLFKRCRRLWGWMSHLRQGRVLHEQADYLWFGTGMHYALEDCHGFNIYGHPAAAFMAYAEATTAAGSAPDTAHELLSLSISMMSYYYDVWLRNRQALRTFVFNGVPQCEVNGYIDLGIRTSSGRPIYYGFTLDRVVIDHDGLLWVQEYKSAKAFKNGHLDIDDQVTAYIWAATEIYKRKVAGVIYQQHRKEAPRTARILKSGSISADKSQLTTASLYKNALIELYGSLYASPVKNIECYNSLASMEDEHRDKFIVRHMIERNAHQLQAFEQKILMEAEEMGRSDLALYPNPVYTCDYMCPLINACISMDDGSDHVQVLDSLSFEAVNSLTQREKEQLKWRALLPPAHQQLASLQERLFLPETSIELELPEGLARPHATQEPTQVFLEELGL